MITNPRIRIGLQKSGRLSDHCRNLLTLAGIHCEWQLGRLDTKALDFPLDLMMVRDDDIPRYVAEGVCALGIVGENMVIESLNGTQNQVEIVRKLGFGRCRLALAVPETSSIRSIEELRGLRIATSYPTSTAAFLKAMGLTCTLVELGGSVEIAPAMGIADAICDLVSSGATLTTHRLREIATVFESEAVLIKTRHPLSADADTTVSRFVERIQGVQRAEKSKYIMMNAPRDSVEIIRSLIHGLEDLTVMPLWHDTQRVAIHAVAPEPVFWETIEQLKKAGATAILVVPIEKIIG